MRSPIIRSTTPSREAKDTTTDDTKEHAGSVERCHRREKMTSPLSKKANVSSNQHPNGTPTAKFEIWNESEDESEDEATSTRPRPLEDTLSKVPSHDIHAVNSTFYSHHSKFDIIDCIGCVAHKLGYLCKKLPNKAALVTGLLCAEEVSFVVSLQVCCTKRGMIRIDFNRIEGDEMNFVRMCDIFENMATVLEGDIAGPKHPDSWLAVDGAPQLNPCPPFYPDQFVSLCNEFLDESGWTDSIYVAASIKGACLPPPNRAKMVALPVVHGVLQCTVCKMILSSSYEISRYGVFVLSLFNRADALAVKFDKTVSDTIHDMQATDAIPRMRDIARIAGNIMVPLPAAME